MNFRDKITIFFRSFLLQAGWNYLRYQSIGFTFVMLPFLNKIYTKKQLRKAAARYLENFNTNPVMAAYAYGALARMEKEEAAQNKFKRTEWVVTKTFLTTSVASIGDRFFWDTLRPLAFMLALLAAAVMQPDIFNFDAHVQFTNAEALFCAAIFLISYNAPALFTRYKGLELAYKSTADNCFGLLAFDWNRAIRYCKYAGLLCTTAVLCVTLYGQFAGLEAWVEFTLLAAMVLFFVSFSFLAEKFSVPVVYIYIITTAVFSGVMIFL